MCSDPTGPGGPVSDPPDDYQTLAGPGEGELRIQRSRFLGFCAPAADEDAARAVLEDIRRRFHDARHVCWAWRLAPPPETVESRNDDGEPSGSAGEPILVEIRKRELVGAVVAVVRYFGGVKLGTGGLARAYGQTAGLALDAAAVRTVHQGRLFALRFPYAQQKTLGRLIAAHDGEIRDETYAADVGWRVWLPHSRWRACAAAVREATAATVELVPAD